MCGEKVSLSYEKNIFGTFLREIAKNICPSGKMLFWQSGGCSNRNLVIFQDFFLGDPLLIDPGSIIKPNRTEPTFLVGPQTEMRTDSGNTRPF